MDLAPVEGTVTLDGQPVADAGVQFQPSIGPSASGSTDANGHFTLVTTNRPGAPLGEHVVSIAKTAMPDLPRGPDGRVDEMKLLEIGEIEEIDYLPTRYSSPATSELTAMVKANGNNFTFSLTSDETMTKPEDSDEASEPKND